MRSMARVLCAMSGGVDSSVAALRLKEMGHEVIGVFLRLGAGADERAANPRSAVDARGHGSTSRRDAGHRGCCSIEDSRDASLVAAKLDIPFYALNYEREFGRVIDYFAEEYHRGRTPNPCARCNQWLKFGTLLEQARALGCEAVATGHYARIEPGPDGRPRLLRALDGAKDQSYFLFLISREALLRTLFPVGCMPKAEVREAARRAGLRVAEKPDSQEICFVPGDYRDVLQASGPERIRPGRFVDAAGADLGGHPGHQHFTVGQRRGLGVALGTPRYVVGIEPEANRVVLGSRDDLEAKAMIVEDVRLSAIDELEAGQEIEAEVQIRHRHRAAPARVIAEERGRVRVEFGEPVSAVTPGQAAVFYQGPVLLGGGWIAGRS
jgi:tRNA-specific 2-thiouridylase